jgi:ABC-type antimicrobial peptide transport system permease subunit
LSIEQRLPQIGVLRATGFSVAAVRRLLLAEGALVIVAGAMLGVLLAVGWAGLMMFGLRTWWRGAVGTTLLSLHVDWRALAAGALGAAAAALVSIVVTVRGLGRRTPRALIADARAEAAEARPRATAGWLAIGAAAGAVALSIGSLAGAIAPAGGFFGAGSLVLVAGLAACRVLLKRRRVSFYDSRKKTPDVVSLALLNAAWRPGRSLTAAGLVAAAVFLLVSVDAFRKRGDGDGSRASGTGGFALIGESALPVVYDLNTAQGRRETGLDAAPGAQALNGVDILGLRLRPGDDTSCLNLYQPSRPRVVGVPDRFVELAPFRFAKSLAVSDADRRNPWRLLGRADAEGIVPAIVDQTSLEYVLHSSVGQVITIDADTARPVQLRIVASLDDSVLQGEILIGLSAFESVFPDMAGARVFAVSLTPANDEHRNAVALLLEDTLEPYGFDVDDPARKLEAFHRVENTYLSTFQALGGLGLMLGIVGLVAILARNVLERRRELALLRASGFTPRDLQRMVLVEHLALVGAGLVIGLAAAFVAIAPVLAHRSGALPMQALIWIAPVAIVGLLATMAATRSVRRLPLVASLRSE